MKRQHIEQQYVFLPEYIPHFGRITKATIIPTTANNRIGNQFCNDLTC